MKKRIFFILVPAIITAAVPAIFSPVTGAIIFTLVVGVGISATRARLERGEY